MKVKAKKIDGKTNFVTDLSNLLSAGKSKEIIALSEEYDKLILSVIEEIDKYSDDKKIIHLHLAGEFIHNFEVKFSERNIELRSLRRNISEDLKISPSRLDYYIRFYNSFKRVTLNDTFSWGIYRELLDIKNETKRREAIDKLSCGALRTTDDIRNFKKNTLEI